MVTKENKTEIHALETRIFTKTMKTDRLAAKIRSILIDRSFVLSRAHSFPNRVVCYNRDPIICYSWNVYIFFLIDSVENAVKISDHF